MFVLISRLVFINVAFTLLFQVLTIIHCLLFSGLFVGSLLVFFVVFSLKLHSSYSHDFSFPHGTLKCRGLRLSKSDIILVMIISTNNTTERTLPSVHLWFWK